MIEFKKIAIKAAEEAGKILCSYFGRLKQISKKKNAGLVTEADKASEKKIISIIRFHFPHHSILAEESGLDEQGSEFKWIIDPLDGTTNFTKQIPFFCISIALEKNGEIILGIALDTIHKQLYIAEKGKGAFCNKRRIFVSRTPKKEEALFVTGFAYQKGINLKQEISYLEPFMQGTLGVRRSGSAVWDFCQVAHGHFDGFWERNLKPWDVASGMLLVQEAGGKISLYNGAPATIYSREIVASNGLVHKQMIKMLNFS